MKLSLITPTGMRPEMFRLCQLWMHRQTIKFDEWIVIDDGATPTECNLRQTVIRPEKKWQLGLNTQKSNLLLGLRAATGDIIAIIEDDDHYRPDYLEVMLERMEIEKADIIGEAQAFYYHLKEIKYHRLRNFTYSPLCQTIFKATLIPLLVKILNYHEDKIDYNFWKAASREYKTYLFPTAKLVVGMKGVLGRPGIGAGHNTDIKTWLKDIGELAKLKQYIGTDVEYYRELIRK